MVCTFYLPKQNDCSCPYCYYEATATIECPVKKIVMERTGPVDHSLIRRNATEQKGNR